MLLATLSAIFWLFLCYTFAGRRNIYASQPLRGDEFFYHEYAEEGATFPPFHYRWLMPTLLGKWPKSWRLLNYFSLIITAPLLYAYLAAFNLLPAQCLAGVMLYLGSYGAFTYLAWAVDEFPDPTANMLALASATAIMWGHPALAVNLALLSATVRETAPVMAALFCLSPLPLLGLVAYGVARLAGPKSKTPTSDRDVRNYSPPLLGEWQRFTTNPLKVWEGSRLYCRRVGVNFLEPGIIFGTWGVLLLAFARPTPWIVSAAALGYLLAALCTNGSRIVMATVFPVAIAHTVLLPPTVLFLAVVVQFILSHWLLEPIQSRYPNAV